MHLINKAPLANGACPMEQKKKLFSDNGILSKLNETVTVMVKPMTKEIIYFWDELTLAKTLLG